MEMHQVRYFLAVARELNFTRAAQQCNVAQPSLTRAIKQLEDELGAELFRRERSLSHLTEFGQRMLPLLQQCYSSALSAKELATSLKTGSIAPLSIALSTAIDIGVIESELAALMHAFEGLELRLKRGTASELLQQLKNGEIEIAIAEPLGEDWERLDCWPLFIEDFKLAVSRSHPLAQKRSVAIAELAIERLLQGPYCECDARIRDLLRGHTLGANACHVLATDHDLISLVGAGFGVAVVPGSARRSEKVAVIPIEGSGLKRTVYAFGVSGRRRSAAATALIKLLRAGDWSRFAAA